MNQKYMGEIFPPEHRFRVHDSYDWNGSMISIENEFNRVSIKKFEDRDIVGKPFLSSIITSPKPHLKFYILHNKYYYSSFSMNLKSKNDIQNNVYSSSALYMLITGKGVAHDNFRSRYNIIEKVDLKKWRDFFLYVDNMKGFIEYRQFTSKDGTHVEYPILTIKSVVM